MTIHGLGGYSPANPQLSWPYQNDSGEEIPAFGVVRIAGFTADDTLLSGEKPDTYGSQYMHFINQPTLVRPKSIGMVTAPVGCVYVKYDNSETPAVGEMWGPVDDSWELTQYVGGFRIVGPPEDEEKIVLVSQCPLLTLTGEATVEHAVGATEDITVFHGTSPSGYTTTSYTVSAFNRYGLISEGFKVDMLWVCSDHWKIIQAEC